MSSVTAESTTLDQNEIDRLLAKYGCTQEIYARTVLLADSAKFVRELQKTYLQSVNIEVVGEANLGIEAIQKYAELRPDLVVAGVHFPDFEGIELISALLKFDKYAQIVVCSGDDRKSTVIKSIGLGAVDYLSKPFSKERFLKNLKGN